MTRGRDQQIKATAGLSCAGDVLAPSTNLTFPFYVFCFGNSVIEIRFTCHRFTRLQVPFRARKMVGPVTFPGRWA